MRKIVKSDCWLWTGYLNRDGYGVTNWPSPGKKKASALVHRLMYEDVYGPIPDGLEVGHKCKMKACCNPKHLRAATHAENMFAARRTCCLNGHLWTESTAYSRERTCRFCKNEYDRNYRAKLKQEMFIVDSRVAINRAMHSTVSKEARRG